MTEIIENKKQTPEDRIMELWIAGMDDYIFKNNIHEILEEDGNELLKNWDISLNTNGSLHLEYNDEDTSSIINLEEKTFFYIIKYKGEVVKKSDNDEYRFHLFRDTIKTVNNYTKYKKAVSRSINTGETIFFSLNDKTVFKKHILSGKFIQKEDGKVYFTNEAFYSSKEGSDDDSIEEVNFKSFNEMIEVEEETDEFFLTTDFIYPSGEGVNEVSNFLQKMEGSLVGKNPFELDLNIPVEKVYVKVYNPDNTLLIETNDDNLITKIRCQIKERKLEGFYLTFMNPEDKTETKISIDSNGRFDCPNGVYYPLNLTEKLSEKLLF
jgi:hypothetical protein